MELIKQDILNRDIVHYISDGKIIDYSEGFFVIKSEHTKKYYYFNPETKEKLGMFLDATPFKEGFASVLCENENNEKVWKYLDKKGNFIPFSQEERLYSFSNGYGKIGPKSFIDSKGNIKHYQLDNKNVLYVSSFNCDRAVVTCEALGKEYYYYIDKDFNRVSDKNYDVALEYSYDRAIAGKRKKRFILDKEENIIFELDLKKDRKSLSSACYTDGLLRFMENQKYGFYDVDGNIAIEAKFNDNLDFYNGCGVYWDDETGIYLVNKKGDMKLLLNKEQIKSKDYVCMENFKGDYSLIYSDVIWCTSKDLIDKEGKIFELDSNVKLYKDYLVLSDQKSYIPYDKLKDLKKDYVVIIRKNCKEIIKKFDNKEQRDKYYDLLVEEKNKAERNARTLYDEAIEELMNNPDKVFEDSEASKGNSITKK